MIHLDMPEKEYRAIPRLSKSDLIYFAESPLHFKERAALFKRTEDMDLGTLVHVGVLEPHRLKEAYILEPETITLEGRTVDVNKRLKAHREWLAAWRAEHEQSGRIIITPKNLERLTGMLERAAGHKELTHLMRLPGAVEASALFERNGRELKGRADKLIDHPRFGRTVFELKTTQSSKPSNFSREILNRSYDLGIACYLRGFEAQEFIFGAIESKAPYPISIWRVPEHVIDRAMRRLDQILADLADCEARDEWPAYTRGIEDINYPAWVPALDAEMGLDDIELENTAG